MPENSIRADGVNILSIPIRKAVYACCPNVLKPALVGIENSPIGYRLAKGTFWTMAGAVMSRGLMLCATVLVARLLGRTVYGEYGIIRSTVDMFLVFAGFGLGLTATKHVAEFRRSDPVRAGRVISLSWIVAVVTGGVMAGTLVVFAPWLAEHTINAPHLTGVLRIAALILFINALNGAQTGALAGFEAFKTIAHINLLVGVLSFPLLVSGAYFGGLTGAVWALAINVVINWLFNHLALRREAHQCGISLSFADCMNELPVLWRFSLPAVLSTAMIGPVRWVCNALLANRPNGYSEMGMFTAALVFQNLILFTSGMLNAPLLSMVCSESRNMSGKLMAVNITSSWILGAIFAVPFLCFPEIAHFLFGADFRAGDFERTFALIVFCTSIMTFKAGLARILAAHSLLWWGFISNSLWAIILISLAVFLVRWGALGLAASLAIAYVANTVVLVPLYYYRRLVPKRTLLSIESAVIWLVLLILLFLDIGRVSISFRALVFIPSLLIVGGSFKRMARSCQEQTGA